jgi:hypothetical protein
MGGPAILNTHAHWEQPQPQKSGRSTHVSLRRVSRAHLPTWRGPAQATTLRPTKTDRILTIEKGAVCGVSNADKNYYLNPRSSSNC